MCEQCQLLLQESEHGGHCPCACHVREEELYAIAKRDRAKFEQIEREAYDRGELVI